MREMKKKMGMFWKLASRSGGRPCARVIRLWMAVCVAVVLCGAAVFGTGISAEASEAGEWNVHLYDLADLFDDEEEHRLAEELVRLQEKMNAGVAIVTCDDNPGSARDYADQFFIEQDIGIGSEYDGALFLIDMMNGELWISTDGKMIRYLTDSRIEAILDDTIEYAYDEDFYGVAAMFLQDLEICYDNDIASDQYNYDTETGEVDRYRSIRWYEFLFALAASLAVAGIAVFAVVRDYHMKETGTKMAANFNLSYRKDSSFTAGALMADMLLNSYTTRTIIQQPKSSGGGSGRSGGGPSLSGGGRSSTHRAGGGRSMGGGGRKFR